jgi:hypothetical protein
MMPDRDAAYIDRVGSAGFLSYATHDRYKAYCSMINRGDEFPDLDVLILEWRFPISGRNTGISRADPAYQPDLDIQNLLISKYKGKAMIIAFDLDYKMGPSDDSTVDYVIELGFKRGDPHHVEIPFDFAHIHDFDILPPRQNSIVYVGNRYERDWAVDKYLANMPSDVDVKLYGNWTEGGRDSVTRWPSIKFGGRLHPSEFREAVAHSSLTPLLLKKEYCDNGFMTARLIESLYFGTMPVVVEEFKTDLVYKGLNYLEYEFCVHDADELRALAKKLSDHDYRRNAIRRHRIKLGSFMDAYNFVDKIERIYGGRVW